MKIERKSKQLYTKFTVVTLQICATFTVLSIDVKSQEISISCLFSDVNIIVRTCLFATHIHELKVESTEGKKENNI